ncbi:hypothetical protein TGAM01_v205715 [Trichoderma gamsii]|uniref:Uncharacterized protein n=1 Tax=Trichoderma gamsii TaxID=398673 RepID=A0A2P4ZMA9_9HYPO|nr:hypothetical protein TGAM01_v205715 [Trichoderma gamsii]PON25421.1 hypothetical protein TGAM01_v205715 [Trichoderma gamsii]
MLCLAAAKLKQHDQRIVLPLPTPIDAVLVPWSCTSIYSNQHENNKSRPCSILHARAAYSVRNKLHIHSLTPSSASQHRQLLQPRCRPAAVTKKSPIDVKLSHPQGKRNQTYQHNASLYQIHWP